MPTTSDAVSREAAWLNSFGDTLPSLNAAQGGPWDLIQARKPRTPPKRKSAIYVTRPHFKIVRFANVRQMPKYTFHVMTVWPLANQVGSEEIDQQNFDEAIDLLVVRILGLELDKTHGGRFLSVAENPEYLTYDQDDPVVSVADIGALTATLVYIADDFEYTG